MAAEQSLKVIQGGMGVGVSCWKLARAVSRRGQLGVVSGTGIGPLLARRLQLGDPGGDLRRAVGRFPVAEVGERILAKYFVAGGKPVGDAYKLAPMPQAQFSQALLELTILASFVEVYLAKEGHAGAVGINFLEKIQAPTLASLFGAMLAGVDYVLMGAGIPRFIPGVLDTLAQGRAAELKVDVEGGAAEEGFVSHFDPASFCGGAAPQLKRPAFLGIIASATLAMTLARKSNGHVDGFVVEGPTAGGHNAPPRGQVQLTASGEPIYGLRDVADLVKIRELGLPFWLAGGYGTPEQLAEAQAAGAAGIQVGTAFAFCDESGIEEELKRQAIALAYAGKIDVRTDPRASPTGFPFKVLAMGATLSTDEVYAQRPRVCDLGYLRRAYRKSDGTLGYRCAAEPVEDFVAKGGSVEETVGRKCLCNALFATLGLGQRSAEGALEPPLVTAGDDAAQLLRYLKPGATSYTAGEVLDYLLGAEGSVAEESADRMGCATKTV